MQFFSLGPNIMQKKWIWTQVPYPPNTDVNYYSKEKLLEPGFCVKAKYDYGNKAGDFLGNSALLTIVSPRLAEILRTCANISTYKVELTGIDTPFEYVGIVVRSKSHPFDPELSKAEYTETGSLSDYDGIYFSNWNGDDIIYINEMPKLFIVSEKVLDLLIKAKVTNCTCKPLRESYGGKYFSEHFEEFKEKSKLQKKMDYLTI
jgi:hypothetical protein